jgi:hypothetical protein
MQQASTLAEGGLKRLGAPLSAEASPGKLLAHSGNELRHLGVRAGVQLSSVRCKGRLLICSSVSTCTIWKRLPSTTRLPTITMAASCDSTCLHASTASCKNVLQLTVYIFTLH